MKKMLRAFAEIFSRREPRAFFAPGRVNLIGEHTDYNGGHVLPCALAAGTYALAAPRDDGLWRLYSLNFPQGPPQEAMARDLAPNPQFGWAAYPLGVAWALEKRGAVLPGADILFWGNLPEGAGLSSSASIEVLTAFIINDFFGLGLSRPQLAQIGQEAENGFVGVNSGIMDQFIVAGAKAGHALSLNCRTLEYRHVPLKLGPARLMVIDSGKRRGLADSKYNQRRRECEAALEAINRGAGTAFQSLGEMGAEDFQRFGGYVEDPTLRKRALHAVTENGRALAAAEALEKGELSAFGRLMNESHASLRYDYEVSGPELDALGETLAAHPACLGARMTGAGFGGCAVALLADGDDEDFRRWVAAEYESRTGLVPAFHPVEPSDGVRAIGGDLGEVI